MKGSQLAQIFALACTVLCSSAAMAYPGLEDVVLGVYPGATNLGDCGTCHTSFTSFGTGLNPYGTDFLNAGGASDPAVALATIESLDSDGDGTSNIGEISTDAGFEPGWSCDTYGSAQNAPGNLADLVDPANVGCGTGTTTTTTAPPSTSTTLPATTTTTVSNGTTTTLGGTTTTTVPAAPKCSQPVTEGDHPLASDCLFILRTAVGSSVCDPACICDTNGTGGTTASDAQLCLKKAVGQSVDLNCQCDGTTTTTLGGTTTTVPVTTTTLGGGTTTTLAPATTTTLGGGTTTTLAPATTTTLGGGTTTTLAPATTTTLGGGTTTTLAPATTTTLSGGTTTTLQVTTTTIGIDPGQAQYDLECASCHAAGSHDPVDGGAGDLAGLGNNVIQDLASISGAMSGVSPLTAEEVANLMAWLNSGI